jgi:predicted nucleic acid-binding protein
LRRSSNKSALPFSLGIGALLLSTYYCILYADVNKTQPATMLFLSAVTIGEIRKGLIVLPQGRRRTELEAWFHTDLLIWFRNRILPVTHSIADRWGVLDGQCQLKGTPLNTADGMIAATALEHGLTLVTRNVRDFAGLGVVLLNPWAAV